MQKQRIRSSAIIIRNNKVLLIHRKKPGQEYWVFPGGGVEDGETPEQALVREVKEETNLDVKSFKPAFECVFNGDGVMHPFYFCDVNGGKVEIIGEEKDINSENDFYHLEWINISAISDMNVVPTEAKRIILDKALDVAKKY